MRLELSDYGPGTKAEYVQMSADGWAPAAQRPQAGGHDWAPTEERLGLSADA